MRRTLCGLILAAGALLVAPGAQAQLRALPSCTGLVPGVMRLPGLVRSGLKPLQVDAVVEDLASTPDNRICTGVLHYADESVHLTFTALWRDAGDRGDAISTHETSAREEQSRALSLRLRFHPEGEDGTFAIRDYVPYCSDSEFIRRATEELHLGISRRDAFYREPSFKIFSMAPNGYGSGVLANCIAVVGDGQQKGAIFLGTDLVPGAANRRYQFYILSAGPDGWKLKNRLWDLGIE